MTVGEGHHGGDRRTWDAAHHQGTVWGWLMGPFGSAHLRVYRDPVLARSFLWPLIQELDAHCVGSLSEIFDGDPPFTPRGCIAQALSWAARDLDHEVCVHVKVDTSMDRLDLLPYEVVPFVLDLRPPSRPGAPGGSLPISP